MKQPSYHPGEQFVQRQFGEEALAQSNLDAISDEVRPGAAAFLAKQSMIVVATHDRSGSPWVSVVFGEPGFVHAESPTHVEIDLGRALVLPQDPLWANLENSSEAGLLALEFSTRKRFKINGPIEREGQVLSVRVEEAFSLCPKYIQRRHFDHDSSQFANIPIEVEAETATNLTEPLVELISQVDTLFVGSRYPESASSDASHRGGPPGFVQVLDEHTLRIPDYPGNGMFNSFGNFKLNPVAGIVLIDFNGRRLLQMTGIPSIRWDIRAPLNATNGTGRIWDFKIERMLVTSLPAELTWDRPHPSPYLPSTVLR